MVGKRSAWLLTLALGAARAAGPANARLQPLIDRQNSKSGPGRPERTVAAWWPHQHLLAALLRQSDFEQHPRAVQVGLQVGASIRLVLDALSTAKTQLEGVATGACTAVFNNARALGHTAGDAAEQMRIAAACTVHATVLHLRVRGAHAAVVTTTRPLSDQLGGAAPAALANSDMPKRRALRFWLMSSTIYLSYKRMELVMRLGLGGNTEEEKEATWNALHELNSDRMLAMCLELRAFYLKMGQFLGTRHDFMPKQYLRKLSQLHDDVPPMPAEQVGPLIEQGLGVKIGELFSSLNLTHPVGSASISQVHDGVLRSNGQRVAVKVQYPDAEHVMLADLKNLRKLAAFLQEHELNFDLVSPVDEMRKQISLEFDFLKEANNIDRMHASLASAVPSVVLPETVLASRRVLVMTFVEGLPFTKLVVPTGFSRRLFASKGKKMLNTLAEAWGHMLFVEGCFNAVSRALILTCSCHSHASPES
eukprot:TRINITY_DN1836_c0_g1_i2.p1 TRINITY_DN1836_c0_g1~~TRINITY_DN1836_c0_g1_i2.p1  ORF type:complete len:478 (-),score=92.03 TRINITY_DN1836_c0_g1_i2:1001-2434(-)